MVVAGMAVAMVVTAPMVVVVLVVIVRGHVGAS
jgi:hypothetical protein